LKEDSLNKQILELKTKIRQLEEEKIKEKNSFDKSFALKD